MTDLPSSQESLPLSQETFRSLWSSIPVVFQEEWSNGINLDGIITYALNSSLDNANNLIEAADSTEVGIVRRDIEMAQSRQRSSLPATEDFPGHYDFTVSLTHLENLPRASPYMYSNAVKKLFVRKNQLCPFNFSANKMLEGFSIRAVAIFSSPDNASEIVVRCLDHSKRDYDDGETCFEHLIQSDSRAASYFKDSVTQRFSVELPFENPRVGEKHSTYLYKFTCFTSCSGGPNRRPLSVIFTLENQNVVLGRRKIDLKVCSCPHRDKDAEENNLFKHKNRSNQGTAPALSAFSLIDITKNSSQKPPTKRKCDDSSHGEKVYTVKVRDEGCYKLLQGVKKWYQITKHVNHLKGIRNEPDWVPNGQQVAQLLTILTSSEEDN